MLIQLRQKKITTGKTNKQTKPTKTQQQQPKHKTSPTKRTNTKPLKTTPHKNTTHKKPHKTKNPPHQQHKTNLILNTNFPKTLFNNTQYCIHKFHTKKVQSEFRLVNSVGEERQKIKQIFHCAWFSVRPL